MRAAALILDGDRVLLVRRRGAGLWSVPSVDLAAGCEDPVEMLRVTVTYLTRLVIRPLSPRGWVVDGEQWWVAKHVVGMLQPQTDWLCQWYQVDELPSLMRPADLRRAMTVLAGVQEDDQRVAGVGAGVQEGVPR